MTATNPLRPKAKTGFEVLQVQLEGLVGKLQGVREKQSLALDDGQLVIKESEVRRELDDTRVGSNPNAALTGVHIFR